MVRTSSARVLQSKALTLLRVERAELVPLLWSFAYYFFLLCSYYILRPVRDEMGIQGGVDKLQWVFTATFVAMLLAVPLFGWAVARYPRRALIPRVYYFFVVNLAVFLGLFHSGIAPQWVARAFFVWLSVFNLFVVSVFWSVMADVFSNAQARRLFGVIAAGGSAGAILGPALTAAFSRLLGADGLLAISVGFLLLAVICVHAVLRYQSEGGGADDAVEAIGGGLLTGATRVVRSPYLLAICLFILLYTMLSTFLYFEQARIVERASADPAQRTALFAAIDLAVNVLTVVAQLFVVARLVAWLGVGVTLMLVPAFVALGFLTLGMFPILGVLIGMQIIRRAGNYAITRPAREILFTVVPRETKYKAKNFIDTVVYRGGDALSGWIFAGLMALGLGLSGIAFIAVPVAAVWMITGLWLGRTQDALRAQQDQRAVPRDAGAVPGQV